MNILLIDNYDSFTWNLVHYLEGLETSVTVVRNDAINLEDAARFDGIVLSPGPRLPKDAGLQPQLIERHVRQKPMLGVCLGFQALVEYFGGTIYNQATVKHGVAETCILGGPSRLFEGLPEKFDVGLYHSWAASKEHFPGELRITAETENGIVMAFEHVSLPVYGVQFHPESVMTEHGHRMIGNFLSGLK